MRKSEQRKCPTCSADKAIIITRTLTDEGVLIHVKDCEKCKGRHRLDGFYELIKHENHGN